MTVVRGHKIFADRLGQLVTGAEPIRFAAAASGKAAAAISVVP